MTQRSYAIVGTGAIGGYYGACLQRAGFPVHFLVHRDYEQVRDRGLRIDSVYGDFQLPHVHAYTDPQLMPPCDVVVIALKSTHNHLLAEILPPLVQPQTTLVLLQNGLGCEGAIAAQFPDNPLIGGLCFICSNKVGPGHIRHLDYQSITLAQYASDYAPCGITPELSAIASDFQAAQIEITTHGNLFQSRWQKLVWNIPYNSLSVILDATTQELMANAMTRQLVQDLMHEVQQGAAACACEITDDFVAKMLVHTEQMTPYLTSMKLDYDHGRPLEHDAIVGNPLKFAQRQGVELPKIALLYQQLQFLDARSRHISAPNSPN